MTQRLEDLVIRLTAENTDLRRELSKASSDIAGFSRRAESDLQQIRRGFTALKVGVAAIAGAEIVQLGRTIAGAAKEALDFGDSIAEASERLGIGTDAIQALRFEAAQSGVGIGQLDSALERFSKRIGLAAGGNDKAAKTFRDLGVDIGDSSGALRSTEDIFEAVAVKIAAIEDPARRVAVVNDLFGKSSSRLIPVLLEAARGFDRMVESAKQAGAVIDEKTIADAAQFSDTLDALAIVIKSELSTALIDLGPILVGTAQLFVDITANVSDMIAAFKDVEDLSDRQLDRRIVERAQGLASTMRDAPGDAGAIASQRDELAQLMAERDARQNRPSAPRTSGGAIVPPRGDSNRAAKEAQQNAKRLRELELQFTRDAVAASGDRMEVLLVEHETRLAQLEELRKKGLDVTDAWIAAESLFAAEVHKNFEERSRSLDDIQDRLKPKRDTGTKSGRLGSIQDSLDEDLEAIDEWAKKWKATADEVSELRVRAHQKAEDAIRSESEKTWEKIGEFAKETLSDAIASAVLDGDASFKDLEQAFLRTLVKMGTDALASGVVDFIRGIFQGQAGAQPSAGSGIAAGGASAAGSLFSQFISNLLHFADGGIVRRPTLAVVGEGGEPEAIIPLSKMRGSGGGAVVNIINQGPPVDVVSQSRRRTNAGDEIDVTVRQSFRRNAQRGEFRDALGQRHQPGVG